MSAETELQTGEKQLVLLKVRDPTGPEEVNNKVSLQRGLLRLMSNTALYLIRPTRLALLASLPIGVTLFPLAPQSP